MDAPILSKKQQAACLSKKAVGKSKKKKTQLKNVIFGETVSRPKASKEVEDIILLKLSDTLKGFPNIFKPVRSVSKQDQEMKRKVRVQLDLGTNCVCRSLEKDRLACVLVSGKVTPDPALDHVIALAQQRGCPLLCLDELSITLAKVTKSKCLPVCIGFKRPKISSGLAAFIDVISVVQKHATVSKRTLKELGSKSTFFSKRSLLPESLRPVCLDTSTDEAVRADLKKIFDNAAINKVESRMMTPKERKRKKNKIKQTKTYYRHWFQNQFESGKKTVTQFVAAGKMQVVLVIRQLMPVLMSEDASTSLLCLARDQDCPVFGVSSLSMVMSPDPANKLAVLGIKKESALANESQSTFRPVIDKCLDFMRTAPMPAQDMDFEELPDSGNENIASAEGDDKPKPGGEDYSFLYVMKKESRELKEKASKLKQEQENVSKQMAFSGDFISFSGSGNASDASESVSLLGKRKSDKPLRSALMRPKKMNMDTHHEVHFSVDSVQMKTNSQSDAMESCASTTNDAAISSETEMSSILGDNCDKSDSVGSVFSVSRGGDKQNKPKPTNQKEAASTQSDLPATSVLGLDALQTSTDASQKEVAEHVSNIFSATSRKPKGEDKKRHGQEGFLSFAYTEANIHTMVANPERKKKKKEKK